MNGDKAELSYVAFLDGKLFAYFIIVDKKADASDLYCQPVDNKTLQLTDKPKKIASIPFESKRQQGSFRYDVSKDKKAIAIIANKHDEKAGKQQHHCRYANDNPRVNTDF